jgi:predicted  nucleic acid-binding Zn-ribbon protein
VDKSILNEFQRRRVSVTFAKMEKDLLDIESFISTEERPGILYKIENDIPKETRKLLLRKIASIRQGIKKISEQFSLEREAISLKRKLRGTLSLLGVDMEEIESVRLRGYGEVAEGLSEALDPQLKEIEDNISIMLKLLRGETGE